MAPQKGKPKPTAKLACATKYLATANANCGKEESTVKAYKGEWTRFVEFVHKMASDEEKLGDICQQQSDNLQGWTEDEDNKCDMDLDGSEDDSDLDEEALFEQEHIPTPEEILDAVEGDPTKFTPWVAALFFSFKAYSPDENRGPSTVDLINAAISDRYKYL
jgi:hypothetical protein